MIDLERIAALVRETARTEVLPRFGALREGEVREKGPGDLVTVADVAAEERLTAALRSAASGFAVLGEEAAARDPSLLSLVSGPAPVWIIDPIDGTINFAHGRPGFATIVALVAERRTVAGWIYDPIEDALVSAARGHGTWCDGVRLTVARGATPDRMTGSAYGRARSGLPASRAIADGGLFGEVRNRLCGGVEYIDIALGRAHFCVHERSLPWDHAAGLLIVEEAGGATGFLDGSDYDPAIVDRPVLAAATEPARQMLRRLLT